LGMALVLGGAIGNLWDRAALGYVIDFISLHYDSRYFPAFNIADSAISAGAVALAIDWLILEPRDVKKEMTGENDVENGSANQSDAEFCYQVAGGSGGRFQF